MRNLKQQIFMSAMSLLLCVSMLLGTTFAWFTDSATSHGNVITSGTLDAEMFYSDTLLPADSNEWRDASVEPVFTYDNWEPGYTDIKYIKVENEGNLAFKWRLTIEAAGAMTDLAEVIEVFYVNPVDSTIKSLYGLTSEGWLDEVIEERAATEGVLLPEGKTEEGLESGSAIFAIILHMDEEADNHYQGKSFGDGFKLNLVATQYAYENDSFDNSYDKDASWPNNVVINQSTTSTVVKTDEQNKSTTSVVMTMSDGTKKATVPAGALVESGKTALTFSVGEISESEANITVTEKEATLSLDVHVDGVAEGNEAVIEVFMKALLPVGLNMGNFRLYHVEDGVTVAMTYIPMDSTESPAHNSFKYDPATGDTTLYMKSFSEIALVADTVNAWNGTYATAFAGGDGSAKNPYLIANADQLAYLGELISNDNANYATKSYKLLADINLGGEENANRDIIFYPIGYHKVGDNASSFAADDTPEFLFFDDSGDDCDYSANRPTASESSEGRTTVWYTYGGSFRGVFDGNGNTIKNIYQNTWQMNGDYEGEKHYWNDAMGIFGYVRGGTVKNLTVDGFTSDGEFTPTGIIAAYAAGNATFESIAIKNSNPRVYNTGNGGIIGIAGSTTAADDDHIILKNITLDNSNKISALWGSWDVACGGLVGMYRGNVDANGNATGDTISFENCHVAAQIDVYNDVCANYQYYAYRYSGMIIGSIRHNTTNSEGRTIPDMTGISASGCTVHFGTWNDYYYCEFEKNSMASYSPDYQFSRVPHSELNFADSNGNGIIDTDGEKLSVNGCKHEHTAEENHQAIYLPFHNLFTGYGWGVSSMAIDNWNGITRLDVSEGEHDASVEKFEGKVDTLVEYKTYKLADLFKLLDSGIKLLPEALIVTVTNIDETNPVSSTIVYNRTNWEDTTISFYGVGAVKITIQDYYFCTPTTITAVITAHEHVYDNACDSTCNVCSATREVGAHLYDNDCDTTCNECGAVRTIGHTAGDVVVENRTEATCTVAGSYDNVNYCTVCGTEISRETVTIDALGHNMVTDEAVAPDCENAGLTEGSHCTRCDYKVAQEVVDATGHKYEAVVTKPTCTAAGYTTYTCACGHSYVADETEALGHTAGADATCTTAQTCTVCGVVLNAALGHKYDAVVTAPTCTADGYTTYTCACGDSYVGDTVKALGHKYDAVVTAPTCTAEGYTTYTCSCGHSYVGDAVLALGHTEVTDEAVDATCTTAGLTEGKHCSVCQEVLVAQQTVDALGHTAGADANCDNAQLCTVCGEVLKAALGHNYEAVVTDPTCTADGYTTYTCDCCGDSYIANKVTAPGHTEVTDEAVDATCTTAGLTEGKHCSVCNEVLVAQTTVEALGHTAGADATCTTAQTCTVCGTELVAALGHTYSTKVTAPTCTAEGYTTYTCACGDSYVGDTVKALGHKHDAVVTAPTCTADGYTTYTCACGDSYVGDTVKALGHKHDAVVTAPTCTADGYTTYTCACGDSYVGDTVGALGHTEETDKAVEATCTTAGLTEGKHCSVCKEVLVAQTVVDALGHTEVTDEAVDATCTTAGLTEGKHCSVCKEVLVAQTTVEALGHTAGAAATCTTAQTCTVCGAVLNAVLGHKYNAVVTAPTCTAEGYTTYTCACGDSYVGDTVKALGHNYNAAVTAPTCTAEGYTTYTCSCGESYVADKVAALGHITSNFTGDFIYRVGNQNAVALGSLFKNIGTRTNVSISVKAASGNVAGTFTENDDWKKATIKFSGTGIVNVTIDDGCEACTLTLEVVDAVNATSATSATANNVVLLNNVGFSSLEVSGGYTLYGNGFTMTCASDSAALDMGYAFVTLDNGTLDNVQIVCPNFDYAVLYKSNMTESGNRSQTTDKTRYYNVKSGVMVSGNSQILNSRISGARAAVNVTGGNCVIDNSRIELGAVASLLVGSANSLTLRDVTLVQKPTASTYDPSKILMGFSVLFVCDADGNAAPVTLEGELVQNAWVDEDDKKYVPSAGQSIISTVLGKTEYLHDIDGDGTKESLNLGFAYMPESLTSKVNTTTITDNRSDKNSIPYDYAEVSILNGKTYVYSYKNTSGTADSFKTESAYTPNKQGDIIAVIYSDTQDGIEQGKSFGTSGWVYELNIDLDKLSGYKLDFSKLSISINGTIVTDYKVDGGAKPSSVAVTAGGVTYTLTATVNGKEYSATLKVTGTETSKESPSLVASNYEAGICVASSYGGTWHGAAPALQGIQIKYWSVAEKQYKTINLADYTPTTKGQLNGTNTTWTYSPANGDFTLTLTGGQVHSSNNVYAMPVVCDGKLYFVAAKSNGLVNSGNSARTIPVSYTFKDNNNGDVLTFSHTWSVAENKDAQYKYSDFCSGTLTKLEKSSGSLSCLVEGSMITLADGTKKAVEELRRGDLVMAFDHVTGQIVNREVIIVGKTYAEQYNKNVFVFDDGTALTAANEHGVFDLDLNMYVNIDHNNYEQYIGHRFVSVDAQGNIGTKTLIDVIATVESGYKYDIVTNETLTYVVEDTLSISHEIVLIMNSYVFGENLTYDSDAMREDIEKYGVYTYEDFAQYCDRETFEKYNLEMMKVGVGKGLYTYEHLVYLLTEIALNDDVQIIAEFI